jgi:hypothetical protein
LQGEAALSEREPHATVAPQAAEASAAGLGTEPPSRSESAGYRSTRAALLRFARENYTGTEPRAVARVLRTVPLDAIDFDRDLLAAIRAERETGYADPSAA